MPLRPAPQLIAASLHHLAVLRLSQPYLRFFGTLLELDTRATDHASPRLIVCARARDFQGLLHSSDSPFLTTPCLNSSAATYMTSIHRSSHVCGPHQCITDSSLPVTRFPEAEPINNNTIPSSGVQITIKVAFIRLPFLASLLRSHRICAGSQVWIA